MKSITFLLIFSLSFFSVNGQNDYFKIIDKEDSLTASGMLEDQDGNYLIGATIYNQSNSSDYLFITIDSLSGQILEEKQLVTLDADETLYSMNFTNDGGLIIGGSYGLSNRAPYLLKLDEQKNEEWNLILPNQSFEGHSAIQLHNNKFIILGNTINSYFEQTYVYTVSEIGVLESIDSISFRVNQVIQSSDNSLVFIGHKSIDQENSIIRLAKTTVSLNEIWTKTYGDSLGQDMGRSIVETEDGGFLLACANDILVWDVPLGILMLKIDSSGSIENSNDTFMGDPNYLSKGPSNKYALSASYSQLDEYGNFRRITSSSRWSEDGEVECILPYEGEVSIYASNTIITSTGSTMMTGQVAEMFEFGQSEIYLTKIDGACASLTDVDDILIANPIKLFPNPIRDVLQIENLTRGSTIEIFNASGQQVYSSFSSDVAESINLQSLNAGLYFLHVNDKNMRQVSKFVKL